MAEAVDFSNLPTVCAATRLNNIARCSNQFGDRRRRSRPHRRRGTRARPQRGRDSLTADQPEKETFTFGWLRLLGTVRTWCRSCAMKLLLLVALETVNGVGALVGV